MRTFKRKALGTGHVKHNLEDKLPEKELHPCPHDSYCFIKELRKKEHCSEHYALNCGQPMKFYNKYGKAGNQMGVVLRNQTINTREDKR